MVTPIKNVPVYGREVAYVDPDFTRGEEITIEGGRIEEVILKCGKGLPRIVFPRIKYTPRDIGRVEYPRLTELKERIEKAINEGKAKYQQVNNDISVIVNDMKVKIQEAMNEVIKGIRLDYQSVLGGSVDKIEGAFRSMYVDEKYRKSYSFSYTGNKEYCEPGMKFSGGWVGFKHKARLDAYRCINGKMEWYQWVITPWAIAELIRRYASLQSNYEEIDKVYAEGMGKDLATMKEGVIGLIQGIPEMMVRMVNRLSNGIVKIADIIKDGLVKMAMKVGEYVGIVAEVIMNIGKILMEYADKMIKAIVTQVEGVVISLLKKMVDTINGFSDRISMGYNGMVNLFNSKVIEPIECKIAEIEKRINFIWSIIPWWIKIPKKA
ncbi:MAG: hypothetical protein QW052_06170 [Candidatus Nitrosocaldaceae archaeon]